MLESIQLKWIGLKSSLVLTGIALWTPPEINLTCLNNPLLNIGNEFSELDQITGGRIEFHILSFSGAETGRRTRILLRIFVGTCVNKASDLGTCTLNYS